MARYVCKNIVAAGLAKKCRLEISYAIGVSQPVAVDIEAFGTAVIPEDKLLQIVRRNFDLTPAGIIKTLDLRRPIYSETAKNGHFGKPGFSWEKTDKAAALK